MPGPPGDADTPWAPAHLRLRGRNVRQLLLSQQRGSRSPPSFLLPFQTVQTWRSAKIQASHRCGPSIKSKMYFHAKHIRGLEGARLAEAQGERLQSPRAGEALRSLAVALLSPAMPSRTFREALCSSQGIFIYTSPLLFSAHALNVDMNKGSP